MLPKCAVRLAASFIIIVGQIKFRLPITSIGCRFVTQKPRLCLFCYYFGGRIAGLCKGFLFRLPRTYDKHEISSFFHEQHKLASSTAERYISQHSSAKSCDNQAYFNGFRVFQPSRNIPILVFFLLTQPVLQPGSTFYLIFARRDKDQETKHPFCSIRVSRLSRPPLRTCNLFQWNSDRGWSKSHPHRYRSHVFSSTKPPDVDVEE